MKMCPNVIHGDSKKIDRYALLKGQNFEMGEKIRKLGEVVLSGVGHEVELNHPPGGSGERQVHIQSDAFRAELNESEFLLMTAAIRLSAEKLRRYKKI